MPGPDLRWGLFMGKDPDFILKEIPTGGFRVEQNSSEDEDHGGDPWESVRGQLAEGPASAQVVLIGKVCSLNRRGYPTQHPA